MNIPSIYINLEDDVSKIVTRLKHQSAKQVVLVCPKRCYLFNDSINLRLLKKQTDLIGKEVSILTMDEKGQLYAKEAGFALRFLPKNSHSRNFSDIRTQKPPENIANQAKDESSVQLAVNEIKHLVKKILPENQSSESNTTPPVTKKQSQLKNIIPQVEISESIFPKEFLEKEYPKKTKKRFPKILIGFLTISLIFILILVFFVLPKATVAVFPKSEPVTRDMEISMSANVKNADAAKLVIPAYPVSETINLTDRFQSQGKKQVGNKASGLIRIYNFTKLPLNLKAATTVITVGNKNYNLVNDVSGLKPTLYSNSRTKEINLSSLADAVEIKAVDGGEDFNLPAGTRMEIANQVFGSKPQLLYAKTESEINGGTTRYLSVISQQDVDDSKTKLLEEAVSEIRAKLAANRQLMPDNLFNAEITQFTTASQVGTETPYFQSSLQVKIAGLAYNEDDLSKLILERINQTLSSNKTLRPKLPISTNIKAREMDLNNQLALLSAHFEGEALYNVDLPNITPELVGKNQQEVYELLKSRAEIERVDITLAPSWQKKFPYFTNKIKLYIDYNDQTQ